MRRAEGPRAGLAALLAVAATLLSAVAALTGCGGDSTSTAAPATPSGAASTPAAGAGPWQSGPATFYNGDGNGACLLGASTDALFTAVSVDLFQGSALCGSLVEVTGPKGSLTLRVVDRCPTCDAGQLDLSAQAFAQIADPVAGRVTVQWRSVPGTQTDPVQYRYKDGSSASWQAIQVRNHRWPVAKLEIQTSAASGWVDVPRTDYNHFVHNGSVAAGPLPVRITASTGSILQDTLPAPQPALQVTGQAQFP